VHGHVLRQGYTAFIHRLYHAYDYEPHVGVLMGARDKGVSPCGDPEEHTVMTPFWQTGSTLSPNFFLAKKLTKLNIARISGYIGIDMLYFAKAQLYRNFPFVAGNFNCIGLSRKKLTIRLGLCQVQSVLSGLAKFLGTTQHQRRHGPGKGCR
jgi:hypothetical protein